MRMTKLSGRLWNLVLVALLLAPTTGCGTLIDSCGIMGDGPRVYGGVRYYGSGQALKGEGVETAFAMALMIVDLPLPAVADTFILPYTMFHRPSGKGLFRLSGLPRNSAKILPPQSNVATMKRGR